MTGSAGEAVFRCDVFTVRIAVSDGVLQDQSCDCDQWRGNRDLPPRERQCRHLSVVWEAITHTIRVDDGRREPEERPELRESVDFVSGPPELDEETWRRAWGRTDNDIGRKFLGLD